MSQNLISEIENRLIKILKEEYSFYQSLYILLDRQRDSIRYQKDEHLLDLYTEIERCHNRINESVAVVTEIKTSNPSGFRVAAVHPEVKKLTNSIVTLIKKNSALVTENEEYLRERYDSIKVKLGELKNSHKILQYMNYGDTSPHFVDGKK